MGTVSDGDPAARTSIIFVGKIRLEHAALSGIYPKSHQSPFLRRIVIVRVAGPRMQDSEIVYELNVALLLMHAKLDVRTLRDRKHPLQRFFLKHAQRLLHLDMS